MSEGSESDVRYTKLAQCRHWLSETTVKYTGYYEKYHHYTKIYEFCILSFYTMLF